MRLLLDTNVLIWWLENSNRLPLHAQTRITNAAEVFVSSASIWELAIKIGAGKLRINLTVVLSEIARHQFQHLPISYQHATQVLQLPAIHHDPFDRILVAQAVSESLKLLTADRLLASYSNLVEVI
jgi:PIN domain nuclease of toxin-antitoxin system